MGLIVEDVSKSLCHFSSHIKITVLILKQIDSMLKRTVSGHVFDDFSIDIKEYFDLIFWEICVFELIIE